MDKYYGPYAERTSLTVADLVISRCLLHTWVDDDAELQTWLAINDEWSSIDESN